LPGHGIEERASQANRAAAVGEESFVALLAEIQHAAVNAERLRRIDPEACVDADARPVARQFRIVAEQDARAARADNSGIRLSRAGSAARHERWDMHAGRFPENQLGGDPYELGGARIEKSRRALFNPAAATLKPTLIVRPWIVGKFLDRHRRLRLHFLRDDQLGRGYFGFGIYGRFVGDCRARVRQVRRRSGAQGTRITGETRPFRLCRGQRWNGKPAGQRRKQFPPFHGSLVLPVATAGRRERRLTRNYRGNPHPRNNRHFRYLNMTSISTNG
jgi:hypothetical protein